MKRRQQRPLRPLWRWLRRVALAVVILCGVGFAWQFARGTTGEYHRARLVEAKAETPTVVAPPSAAPTGNRLVWGPPMHVVIRGEHWTVRTVMQEAE